MKKRSDVNEKDKTNIAFSSAGNTLNGRSQFCTTTR